ncbi:MAG TPA: DUF4388 domain-containing protein, partial [Candidatus Angelobacter sp.]|nr:DUF4388 domain-containing protein [Candidatus Angelobacter sp.]
MPDKGFPVPVDSALLELATQRATGCLTLTEPEGEQATVWFRDGLVYAVSVPGRRPLLGVRLMSSGALTPEALAEALEVQRTELQGWRLGELLVHLQFVDRVVVESFVTEQVRDQVADLLHWSVVASKFRNGKRTRQDVAPPIEVTDLITLARERDERWAEVVPFIGGADGVPVLATSSDASSDIVLGPHDWALLCKVDGIRTIADLADDCGFTVFEAGMVVVGLLDAGLVEIENLTPSSEAPGPSAEDWTDAWSEDPPTDDDVAESVAKVAAALHDMNLGPAVPSPFSARPVDPDAVQNLPTGAPQATDDDTPRRSRLAAAPVAEGSLAPVVSLADEREARDGALAQRLEDQRAAAERGVDGTEPLDAQHVEIEPAPQQTEAERIEAAWAEAERRAAEHAEELRLRAERLEFERAERLEAERVEAERLEAERIEAERVEAERLEAERLEAERLEAERL